MIGPPIAPIGLKRPKTHVLIAKVPLEPGPFDSNTLSMRASCCGVDGMTISLRTLAALDPSAGYTRYTRSASSLLWGPQYARLGSVPVFGSMTCVSAFWRVVDHNVLAAGRVKLWPANKHALALASSTSRIYCEDFVWRTPVIGRSYSGGYAHRASQRELLPLSAIQWSICFPVCITGQAPLGHHGHRGRMSTHLKPESPAKRACSWTPISRLRQPHA
jgi:hypothetical protein